MNMRKIVLWLALASCLPTMLFGQTSTATVRGVVMDSSEAAVPEAAVIVKDVNRNTERRTVTDNLGRYVISAIPPGTYTLSVEAAGFQKYQRSAFQLAVQQDATVDVRLQVGEVTTSVVVESAAPLLNTANANLGQVIDNRYIDSLPQLDRRMMSLTMLAPGVTAPTGNYVHTGEQTNFTAVGTRNATAEVMLDGQTMVVPEHNSGITMLAHAPVLDAIEEFKVQTGFFSAEFGNTGGAIVNMITKSGTNEFHGSGYWYYRNAVLNANGFFSNRAGSPRIPYSKKLYGGTVGGPIVKDRTFAFFSYERQPAGDNITHTATFPTMQQRQGDFSDYLLNGAEQINIFNPFDTYVNSSGYVKRRPFANNVVPKTMFDPIAVAAASYYPEPNQPGIIDNWYFQGWQPYTESKMVLKVDHNFNEKDRISGRWDYRKFSLRSPNAFGEGQPGDPWEHKRTKIGGNNLGFDYTRAHSARTVINIRYGLLRSFFDSKQLMQFDFRTLGLPQYMYDTAMAFNEYADIFPRFSPSGYTEVGNPGWGQMDRWPKEHQVVGSITRITGGHNLKIGGEVRRMYLRYLQPSNPGGSFSFSDQLTSQDLFTPSNLEGNGFATMLLGWPSGGSLEHKPFSNSNAAYVAAYIQDEWKVTRKLTLNLGLRYELPMPRWENEYRETFWNLDGPSPLQGRVPGFDLTGYLDFCTRDNRSPFYGDHDNFGPRLGFAYALNNKTTIRGGYATLYTIGTSAMTGSVGLGFTSSSGVIGSRDNGITQFAHLNDPWPLGFTLPIGRSKGPMSYIGLGATVPTRDNVTPLYHSFNFSVQRQLPGDNLFEVNYASTKGVHQYMSITNLNPLDPMYWGLGRPALQAMVPNPFYGIITDPTSPLSLPTATQLRFFLPHPQYDGVGRSNAPAAGDTIYHSVQFKFERRFSRGLAVLAHYTISKALDNVGGGSGNWGFLGGGSTSFQDIWNLKNEKALSPSDIPQRLVLTFSYDLPVGTGKALGTGWGRITNALLGGWQLGGFMTFQSGAPLQVSQSSGQIWGGSQRPNLVGDPSTSGPVVDRLMAYYNPAAFSKPPADVPGTAPRFLNYRAPGIRNADLSMLKAFTVREGIRGEFRFEAQNATNTPSFGAPSSSFGSNSFGRITGVKIDKRQCQMGLKFRF